MSTKEQRDKVKEIKTKWDSLSTKWSKLEDSILDVASPFDKGDLIQVKATNRIGLVQSYDRFSGKTVVLLPDTGEIVKLRSFEISLLQKMVGD